MAQATAAARRPGVNIFDESRPLWLIFVIFLVPMMLSNILQSASQTIGSVFLGRLIGTDALAAVSAVFPIVFLLFSFLFGIASGSSVLIGQAFGAGDEHKVKKVAGTVLGATVAFSIVVAIVGELWSPQMLQLLGTPANIIAQSDAYTRVIFLAAPVLFPYLVYTTFLRGIGDAQTPFYFLLLSTLLFVPLMPALILGWWGLPRLGVVSVAVASLLSQGITFAALLVRLRLTNHPLQFDMETARDMFATDWRILWNVLRIGIPTGIQMIMLSLSEVAIISFVNHFGSSATAAYGAVNQVVSYVQFPAISIGITASIFGAQSIGARREDMLTKVVRTAVGLNYVIGGVIIAVCYVFAWQIIGWFITDQHTLLIAHTLLMITLWSYLLFGNSSVISGVVRSSGAVFWPTVNGIFAIWGIEVPAAYLLMRYFGVDGVWMGYPISFVVVVLLQFFYYERFWKRRTHARLV